MAQTGRKEIFATRVSTGSRTYFLDVSETHKGERMLSICESRRDRDGFLRSRLYLFGDSADDFVSAFRDALRVLKTGQAPVAE